MNTQICQDSLILRFYGKGGIDDVSITDKFQNALNPEK